MPFSTTGLNQALNGVTVDAIRLHTGDPGAAGTGGTPLGAGIVAATFNSASAGERTLDEDVNFTGLGANAEVGFYSLWETSGTIFKGGFPLAGGSDTTANAAGEYTLKELTTKMTNT
jgi:hypothetical protein